MAVIRWARPDDAGAILGLIRELAEFERAPDAVKATEADIVRDGWGATPRFECLIGEHEGAVAGFALFFHNYSTWVGRAGIFVEDLYVKQALRGLGLGRELLAAVAALTVARGLGRLELNVLDWNPARGFYERLGFQEMTEWRPYRIVGPGLAALAAGSTVVL